jgi:hypothetical protein
MFSATSKWLRLRTGEATSGGLPPVLLTLRVRFSPLRLTRSVRSTTVIDSRLLILFPLVLLLLSGCGRGPANRGAIGGAVKLDGKLLEQGSILFTPIEGTHGSVAGGKIENGRYEFSAKLGPAIGRNRVEIRAMRKTGKMVPKAFGRPGEMVPEQVEAIPPRFNSESKLTVDIKPGDNTADFDVSSR